MSQLPLLFTFMLLVILSPTSAGTPDMAEIMELAHLYFPSLNENTTILSFLRNEQNIKILERIHLHSCLTLKRKRKVRSIWDKFTNPIDQAILNGTTFELPKMYTLNSTEEEIYSKEGKFFNPYSPPFDDTTNVTGPNGEILSTTASTIGYGKTQWPTNAFGERVPKKNMKAFDYFNLINNDIDGAKSQVAAGGCPLGFG